MIGDIIVWLRRVKQEMFCIHDYEERICEDNEYPINIRVCKKCGRH